MRVKYIAPVGGEPDSWLTDGGIYTVLSVYADQDGIQYRLSADDGSMRPVLHQATLFTIVSHRIPPTWVINVSVGRDGHEFIEIAPLAWIADGFWERYFDSNDEAENIFRREERRMILDEGGESPSVN